MIKRSLIILLSVFLIGSPIRALDLGFAKEDAGQPGTFLDYAASARSLAMGRAHTGVADDASAAYWNPSGLAQIRRKDFVTMFASLEEDSNYSYFSYAHPMAYLGTFGLSMVNLRSGEFERRTRTGQRDGTFALSDTAFMVSHGKRIHPNWSIGTGFKFIRQSVDGASGNGFGMDVGTLYHFHPKLQLGAAIRNLLPPKVTLQNDEEKYPMNIRLGAQYRPSEKWLVATDLDKTSNRSIKLHLGGEWRPHPVLALRAGINESEISTGLGIILGDWELDYAFGYNDAVSGQKDLGGSHKFGLHFHFGKNVVKEEETLMWRKRGNEILSKLKDHMRRDQLVVNDETRRLAIDTHEVVRNNGFESSRDLHEALGYAYYIQGKYEKSTYNLSEALSLEESPDRNLFRAHKRALDQMTEEQTNRLLETEMVKANAAFDRGDYKESLRTSRRILEIDPQYGPALSRIDQIKARMGEPVVRGIKKAKQQMANGKFLEAIKSLQEVQQLEPDNNTANQLMIQSIQSLEKSQGNVGPARIVQEVERDLDKSRQFYSKGLQFYSRGDLLGAKEAWEKALKYNANNSAARNAYDRVLKEIQ